MTNNSDNYLTILHQLLSQYFNLEEIRMLCFKLNVDQESITDNKKNPLIRELLLALGRRSRLPELITLLQQERPNVNWPPLPNDFKLPTSLSSESTAVAGNQFYGDVIQGDKFSGDKVMDKKIVAGTYVEEQVIVQGIEITDIEDLPAEKGKPPYQGLLRFDVEDYDRFFGRETLTSQLVNRLYDTRFLAVIGASGSGKSSVVRAGVVPAMRGQHSLEDGLEPPLGKWEALIMTPTARPLTKLAKTLFSSDTSAQKQLYDKLVDTTSPTALTESINDLFPADKENKLLLVIDQFEELFTSCKNVEHRQIFINNLLLGVDQLAQLCVIITLRADFYDQAIQLEGLDTKLEQQQAIVTPMQPEELTAAILKPAEQGNWKLQDGLMEQLLLDVGVEPGSLPLLSHALFETWRLRRGRIMTHSGYLEAGGVKSAITQTASKTYEKLKPGQQAIAKQVFLRLTDLGLGDQVTRRQVEIKEIGEDKATQNVLNQLANDRLVTIDKDMVEVAHEALIREWDLLQDWLKDEYEWIRLHRRLTESSIAWLESGKENSLLYRGIRLSALKEALATQVYFDKLNQLERRFLKASMADERKRKFLARTAIISLIVLFITASVAALFAINANLNLADEIIVRTTAEAEAVQEAIARATSEVNAIVQQGIAEQEVVARATSEANAIEQKFIAEQEAEIRATREAEAIFERDRSNEEALKRQAQYLAAESDAVGDGTPQLSLLLAIEAANVHSKIGEQVTAPAVQALRNSLNRIGGFGLGGHWGYVSKIDFSPDGRWFATADTLAGEIRLWDLMNENPSTLPIILGGHENAVTAIDFSPDSHWLASAGGGNVNTSTRVLDAIFNSRLNVRYGEVDGYDTAIRLWNLDSGEVFVLPKTPLHDDNGFVNHVEFVDDGANLVSIDLEGTVLLWDLNNLSDPEPPKRLTQLSSGLFSVATSPNTQWLVITDNSGTLYRWDFLADDLSLQPDTLEISEGFFRPIDFSPDGSLLAIGGNDGKVLILDISNPDLSSSILSEYTMDNEVSRVSFSPDGNWFASGTRDGQVLVWEFDTAFLENEPMILNTQPQIISHLEFSQDGNWLIVNYDEFERSDSSGDFELWSIGEDGLGKVPERIAAHESKLINVDFSPDGIWLASSSVDGTARLWRLGSFALSAHADTLSNSHIRLTPQNAILAAAFDPESEWLVTADDLGELRLWSISNLNDSAVGFSDIQYTLLDGHEEGVRTIAVSSSRIFATGSDNGTIRLTEINDDGLTSSLIFQAHDAAIDDIVFSEDGTKLISAGRDNVVRIWDLGQNNSPGEPLNLETEDTILSIALDPTGRWLAGGGFDANVYLWDLTELDPTQSLEQFTGHELEIDMVDISPDGRWLATGSVDTTLRLWDLQAEDKQESVRILRGHTDFIVSVAFSPDGNWLASGSFDNTARLWPIKEGDFNEGGIVLNGDNNYVFNLQFSPDNKFLYTSNFSGLIQSWNLDQVNPENLSTSFSANIRPVGVLEVSPDNRWLFSGGQDGKTTPGYSRYITSLGVPRLWPLQTDSLVNIACVTAGRNLSLNEFTAYFPDAEYSLTCPDIGIHPSVLETARAAAINGDREQALRLFSLATELDKNIIYNPTVETERWLAQGISEEARSLARNLELEESTILFSKALALDPTLGFEPEAEAKRFAAPEYAWEAFGAAANDNIEQALEFMALALSYNPDLNRLPEGVHSSEAAQNYTPRERLALGYNLLCTEGINAGLLEDVLLYCEESVRLDPDLSKGNLREGRAMARAMQGDFETALIDINLYITWLELGKNASDEAIDHWKALRDEIAAGRNPFTDEYFTSRFSRDEFSGSTPSSWTVVSSESLRDNATAITLNSTITDTISFDDYKEFTAETGLLSAYLDIYEIAVNKGDTLIISIHAEETGSELDSYIMLYNSDLIQQAYNDDSFGADSSITFTFDDGGAYYVMVSDYWPTSYGDSTNFYYVLEIEQLEESFPIVDPITISEIAIPLSLGTIKKDSITKDDYKRLEISDYDTPAYRYGDFFQVELEKDSTVLIQTRAEVLDSDLDTVIFVYDEDYYFLDSNNDGEGLDSELVFEIPESGIYYIFIRDSNEYKFGDEGEYFYEILIKKQ